MTEYAKTPPDVTATVGTGANRDVKLIDMDDGLYATVKFPTSGRVSAKDVKVSDVLDAGELTAFEAAIVKLEKAAVEADGFTEL